MLLQNKAKRPIELQGVGFSGEAVSEALRIEEVLSRAHQNHRARGGLIGYDLEDWLEAERELSEKNRLEHSQTEEMEGSNFLPWNECETGNEICFFSGEFRTAFWSNAGKPTDILEREYSNKLRCI
jgi:hypothetical protein